LEKEINYSVTDRDGVKVVKFEGSISNSNKSEFEKTLNNLTQKYNIILDMNKISVITSGGLSAMINVSLEAHKRRRKVMIMGLREAFIKMMEVMGMLQYIIFIENIEDGIAKVNK
jgi:anti-anti-sigma factor